MNKGKYLLFFIMIIFFSCGKNEELSFEQDLSFDSSVNTIIIKNPSKEEVALQWDLNSIFPIDEDRIKKDIEEIAKNKDVSVQSAAWKYVYSNSFKSLPFSPEYSWGHEPLIYLNSLGGGYCDDRASVLAGVWKNWFDSVKVMVLEGHVVPEVKVNNNWEMYDPDYGVAYKNDNGEVASFKELENNWKWIAYPSKEKIITINPSLKENNTFSYYLSQLYKDSLSNRNETEWHLDYEKQQDWTIVLPSFSSLVIQFKDAHIYAMYVNLSKKSKGKLQNPFIPHYVEGNILMNIHDREEDFKKYSFTNISAPHNVFKIIKSDENAKVFYLVNPKINVLKDKNLISVLSSQNLKIKLKNEDLTEVKHFAYDFFLAQNNVLKDIKLHDKIAEEENFNYKQVKTDLKEYLKEQNYSQASTEEIMQNFTELFQFVEEEDKLTEFELSHPYMTYLLCLHAIYGSSDL